MNRRRKAVGTAFVLAFTLSDGRNLAADGKPCADIDRLVQEAATDFRAIASPSPDNAEGVSLALAGAKECTLHDSVYECQWVVESPDKGIEEFEVFAGSLAQCLKPQGFDIDQRPGFFLAFRRGVASVVADWSREFLTIHLQVEKEK